MHHTARVLAATACATLALLQVPAAASAGSARFGRQPLVHDPLTNCERGADALPGTGTASRSLVVIRPSSVGVGVLVNLRGAVPEATYHVFVVHTDGRLTPTSAPDCYQEDGILTTDRSGNGILRLDEAAVADHPYVHVYLYTWASAGLDLYDTGLVDAGVPG